MILPNGKLESVMIQAECFEMHSTNTSKHSTRSVLQRTVFAFLREKCKVLTTAILISFKTVHYFPARIAFSFSLISS